MDTLKRFVGIFVFRLASFLDTYFYHIAALVTLLGLFNYFFIKNYDKILFVAAKDGNIKDLKDALVNDADVNIQHAGDCTALMMACGTKQEKAVVILVSTEKCKLELSDIKGRTALLIASSTGSVEIVKLLLKNKADVKTTDHYGSTPLIAAACRSLLCFAFV